MTAAASQPRDWPEPVLRVILVGRTGMEVALRREPSIELTRVATALEAVGEVANPIDAAGPRRVAVVIARDADPVQLDPSAPGADTELVAALRAADAGTAVLLLDESRRGQAPAGAYDLAVGLEDGLERLRRLAARIADAEPRSSTEHRSTEPRTVEPPPTPSPPAARAPRTVEPMPASPPERPASAQPDRPTLTPEPAPAPPALPGDARVVEALLAGRDLLLPALEVIRARLGLEPDSPAVRFIAADATRPGDLLPGAPAQREHAAPVSHRGRLLGSLRSAALPSGRLAPHASWLALWLTLAEQQAALRQAAMLDELTGAYNRRYFQRYAQAAIDQAQRDRNTVTILLFDIDDFKRYNDRFGHAAGDEILTETVKLLRSTIRPHDRVCRIGGDEFAVVFYEPQGPRDPGSKPPDTVFQIARRFQEQIRQHRFPKLSGQAPGTLTVSGGLATFPWDGRTIDELLEHADRLAMESKRAGKNAITLGPANPPYPAPNNPAAPPSPPGHAEHA
jgi:diguanylate cyclase (GGDEF)-like protein